jgi:hypothetical protein
MLLGRPRCALSLRLSFAPTWRLKDAWPDFASRLSSMLVFEETADKSALQFRQHRAGGSFPLVEVQKLALNRFTKLTQICSPNGVADRDDNLGAGLDQDTCVDGDVYRAFAGVS